MAVYSWTNNAGGDFDEESNWSPPNSGIPGSDDSAFFSVGGTYTVFMGGQDLIGISTSDNLTLRGPFNVSDGIGGTSSGGTTKTLKLEGGAVTAGLGISGDALVLQDAAIIAGSIGNGTSILVSNSSVKATEATGGFTVDHKITIASSTIVSSFVSLGLSFDDAIIKAKDSALRAVENGDNTGLLLINGSAQLSAVKASAEVSMDVAGAIDWQGGAIKTDLLRLHKSSNGLNDIVLDNVTAKTDTVSGALNGSANPAQLTMVGGHWENKSAYESSGTVLFRNADLQTGSFGSDPEMGSGADVTFIGSATLLVDSTAAMAKLTLKGGANATVDDSLSLVTGGEIIGGGSLLKVASLTAGGTLKIVRGADVVANRIEAVGGVLIGQHSGLHAMGAVEKGAAIGFAGSPKQAVLEIGKLNAFDATIQDFAPGARIRIDDMNANAKMSVEVHDGNTNLTFAVGKKTLGELTLEGRFGENDLHFLNRELTATKSAHSAPHDGPGTELYEKGQWSLEDGGSGNWFY